MPVETTPHTEWAEPSHYIQLGKVRKVSIANEPVEYANSSRGKKMNGRTAKWQASTGALANNLNDSSLRH